MISNVASLIQLPARTALIVWKEVERKWGKPLGNVENMVISEGSIENTRVGGMPRYADLR